MKSSLNLLIKISKQQTAMSDNTSFPGLIFSKNEGKQQVCYLETTVKPVLSGHPWGVL